MATSMIASDGIKLAWAAGLFEGEGCFSLDKQTKSGSLRMSLKMTDEDVVRNFHKVVGFGSVNLHYPPSKKDNGHKKQWLWVGVGKRAEELGWILSEHLGSRRRMRFLEIIQEIRSGS